MGWGDLESDEEEGGSSEEEEEEEAAMADGVPFDSLNSKITANSSI